MLSKNQLGFLYMFMSVCAFSVMDLIVKWSEHYPLGQVLFFRGFFGVIIYFFIMPRERIKNFYQTKRIGLHFLRCFFGLIALIAIFIALRNLPLATVVSISFAAPIFTTIFSIFFLSEKVGFYRWLANLWLGQSFKLSEVSLVSPLKYLALVFGIIFGYFIWDEVPTIKTLLGAMLVVFSSLIILRREIHYKEKIPSTTRHE